MKLNDKLKIHIFAYAALGEGLSGGDRIFIEFARRWKEDGYDVEILTGNEGCKVCKDNKLDNIKYTICSSKFKKFGFAIHYMERFIRSCIQGIRFSINKTEKNIIYSASDFWPDSIPAFIIKKRFPDLKWIAGFYFFAPSPFKSLSDISYRGGRIISNFRSMVYYFSQKLSYWLIKKYADVILVSNQLDKDIFIKDRVKADKIKPIYGGVDIQQIQSIPEQEIKYDGCFVGRFHIQKGALELIKIWSLVCKNRKDAKLALIGVGPLELKLKDEIKNRNLESNIDMLGFMDGEKKYEVLKSSRIFLHTPILDTGGMAAAEGMASGLPVVGFDLPGYQYCYPKGMLKAPIGDLERFADLVLSLLNNDELYKKMKKEALEFSKDWDWSKKVELLNNELR